MLRALVQLNHMSSYVEPSHREVCTEIQSIGYQRFLAAIACMQSAAIQCSTESGVCCDLFSPWAGSAPVPERGWCSNAPRSDVSAVRYQIHQFWVRSLECPFQTAAVQLLSP